jgi:PAS domain S-box-containing protein
VTRRLDLSISQRLAAGFGMLLLILGGFAIAVARWQATSAEAERRFVEEIAPRQERTIDLERSVLNVATALRAFALTPTADFLASHRSAVEDARMRLFAVQPESSPALEENVRAAVEGYIALTEEIIAHVEANEFDVEAELELQKSRQAALARVRALSVTETQNRKAALTEMRSARENVAEAILVASLAAIFGFVWLAVLTARAVRAPAVHLMRTATALERGDWKPALALAPSQELRDAAPVRDEMLHIARAFGSAAVALERREHRLRTEGDVAAATASSLEDDVLCDRALEIALEYAEADVGVVYVMDDAAEALVPVALHALDGDAEPQRVGEGIVGEAARTGRPVITREIPADTVFRVKLGFAEAAPKTVAAFPITFAGRVHGVLLVASLRELTDDVISFLERAAAQLGIGLENVSAYERAQRLLAEVREKGEHIQAQNEELQVQNEEIQAQSEQLKAQQEEIQAQYEELEREANERARAAERLEISEGRFRELADHVGELFYSVNAETGELLYVNRLSESLWGVSFEDLRDGRAQFAHRAHPDDREAIEGRWQKVLEGEPQEMEYRVQIPDSDTGRTVLERAFPVLDPEGRVQRVVGVARDITADRALEAEHRSLNLQIQQAQKMDAIGRLAGGIAHDFNNMLGVILGYANILRRAVQDEPHLVQDIQQIVEAGERSAALTGQLLAFARRQPIAPRDLDLDAAVEATLHMVRRLVGEGIELSFRAGDAGTVRMDPTQLDQILVNLAINARDAMPEGGHLVFETMRFTVDETYRRTHAEAPEGEFALLVVSDDGCGMDANTRERLFEPFFTTKEAGEGTGLGLSTVYGIVKQNGGMIGVYSEPGRGTTFRIYFPIAVSDESAAEPSLPAVRVGGDETVLLVEDEPRVRAMTERLLADLGYHVLTASRPSEALEVAAQYGGPIQLLLTDVVMPEMSGRDLWERLSPERPDMRCLFVSGYTADILGARGIMEEGVCFLAKPFSADALAAKIREALAT